MGWEGSKKIKMIINPDGTKMCAVARDGFIEKRLYIRKETWDEIGKLMNWKQ